MKNAYLVASACGLIAAAAVGEARAATVEAGNDARLEMYTQPQRLVTLEDGRRMNLHCTGIGSPTVLLEGGWATTTIWWRDIQPALAAKTRVCSHDRAGFGFSDAGPMPRTAAAIASDLHATLVAAKIEGPYVLVAHSLGGLDVRLFADQHRNEVAGMVLLDPSVEHQVERMGKASPAYRRSMAGFVAAVEACSKGVIAGTVTADMPASRTCIDPPSRTLPAAINAARRAQQLTPAYQRTAASELSSLAASSFELDTSRRSYGDLPLIVLTAAQSNTDPSLAPAEQTALDKAWWDAHADVARLSSKGSHRLVPDTSHFIPKDKPQLVIETILEVVEAAQNARGSDVE